MSISIVTLDQINQAKAFVLHNQWTTISLIQRRLKLGYQAAIQTITTLQSDGVLIPQSRGSWWWVADAYQKPELFVRLARSKSVLNFAFACRKLTTDTSSHPVASKGFSVIAPTELYDVIRRTVITECLPEQAPCNLENYVTSVLKCLQNLGYCLDFPSTDIELLEWLARDTCYKNIHNQFKMGFEMGSHRVVTKDFPENLKNGIMICGINYGYSDKDETKDAQGSIQEAEPLSFFSDATVNNSRYRARILSWLASWGIHLETQPGKEGVLERSFWQTNWLDTQSRSISSHEKVDLNALVNDADSILDLIAQRQPSLIILIGTDLIEALNDIRLRERVETILGPRPGKATEIFAATTNSGGTRFKMRVQSFKNASIICLPHTATIGLTNEQVASFELPAEIKEKFLR